MGQSESTFSIKVFVDNSVQEYTIDNDLKKTFFSFEHFQNLSNPAIRENAISSLKLLGIDVLDGDVFYIDGWSSSTFQRLQEICDAEDSIFDNTKRYISRSNWDLIEYINLFSVFHELSFFNGKNINIAYQLIDLIDVPSISDYLFLIPCRIGRLLGYLRKIPNHIFSRCDADLVHQLYCWTGETHVSAGVLSWMIQRYHVLNDQEALVFLNRYSPRSSKLSIQRWTYPIYDILHLMNKKYSMFVPFNVSSGAFHKYPKTTLWLFTTEDTEFNDIEVPRQSYVMIQCDEKEEFNLYFADAVQFTSGCQIWLETPNNILDVDRNLVEIAEKEMKAYSNGVKLDCIRLKNNSSIVMWYSWSA